MKFAFVLVPFLAATTTAQTCENVKVVGDGTFCITGPVCSGTPGGKACPQVGDTAVSDCLETNPSFDQATGKCTAPVPADCKPTPEGVWGCIWDLSKLPAPPANETTTSSPPAKQTEVCDNVSVVGDGTFCVQGPVCSGTVEQPGGTACPKVGDTAVSGCLPSNPSFDKTTGKCTAPVPADCKPTSSGAWGCIWDLSKLPGGAPPAPNCSEVSVVGDGTFCIDGPVCSGTAEQPGGTACPKVGDTAIMGCFPSNPSYDKTTGKCTAPVPADCKPTSSGAWGCIWDLSKLPGGIPAPVCENVSVEGDGTFCINGPVCSGTGSQPTGTTCPKVGDTAVDGCTPFNPSFDKATGKCTAPVPADCKPTSTGVWGCIWDLSKLPVSAANTQNTGFSSTASGGSAMGATIGAIVAVAAIAAAIVGTVVYKKRQVPEPTSDTELETAQVDAMEMVLTPKSPVFHGVK